MKFKTSFFVACAMLSLGAANAIQPQNGFWAINGELNGHPGRGFQIDVQGDVLVFSYYGYRSDGSATFYLSSGKYDSEKGLFNGTLFEYQGGTPIGESFRNGVEAGSPGQFSLQFLDSNKGYLTLPGEPRLDISRFTFSDPSGKFNNTVWEGEAYGAHSYFNGDSTDFTFNLSNGIFSLKAVSFFTGTCIFDGNYTVRGTEIESNGTYRCSDFTEGSYAASRMTINADGTYTGVIVKTPAGGGTPQTNYHTARNPKQFDNIFGW